MTAASRSIPNTVERSIRGLALNRKNARFAGHGLGAENRARLRRLLRPASSTPSIRSPG
jgi:hypothetical protein